MKRTTTLIAEDEPLASEGLAGWVREMPELELVGICADGPGTRRQGDGAGNGEREQAPGHKALVLSFCFSRCRPRASSIS